MAKTFKTLEEAVNSIVDDYARITRKVVKDVALQVQKDIQEKAEQFMDEYYNEYTPTSYNRTESLKNSIVPYYYHFESKKKQGICGAVVGIEYDLNQMKDYNSNSKYHQSNSKFISKSNMWNSFENRVNNSRNGFVDSSWVLENYLKGIHPTTNGYPFGVDTMEYIPVIVSGSPREKINKWLTEYAQSGKIDEYFFKEYTRRLLSRIR